MAKDVMGPPWDRLAPYCYPFIRVCTGAVLVPHGVQKIMTGWADRGVANIASHDLPFPVLLAYLAVFSESVAAACLALGLFTRMAALVIWIQMGVIVFVFQWPNGYFWTDRGFEYPLLLWLLCAAILVGGGGRYSVDHLIGRES